ncbi:chaperone NapD [Marinobacter salicampi]|uniref:chaperone NapD n=1 Tax=Marinobacter salicampi TaxID=435907 RepID=UPI001A94F87D|nr:chaperone NapD [Marinobacter salicampi]
MSKSDQCHIASFIVHVHPDQSGPLLALLEAEPALEVHGASPEGKLVVVMESSDQQGVADTIDRISQQTGVLNCVLVYHEVMTGAEGDQELIGTG